MRLSEEETEQLAELIKKRAEELDLCMDVYADGDSVVTDVDGTYAITSEDFYWSAIKWRDGLEEANWASEWEKEDAMKMCDEIIEHLKKISSEKLDIVPSLK